MTRSLMPPRGLFIGTRWAYDPQLSASVKETLLQLMTLTWGRDGHTTPPLSYPLLEHLTGKPARTLRGHIQLLRTYHAALRFQRAETGEFIIALAGWLFRNDVPAQDAAADSGEILPVPVKEDHIKEEEEEIPQIPVNLLPPPSDPDHALNAAEFCQEKPGNEVSSQPKTAQKPRQPGLSRALEKRLRDAGVFPKLLGEVASLAEQYRYTAADINRLLDWCMDDQPESPAPLFVGRVRAGARAPAVYAKPPCPGCGMRGKHDPECRMRYAMDED
jgi:hypothetical protein